MKPNDRVRATHPESTGMPPSMELPEKEQELIRALQRDDPNAEACGQELINNYGWGEAKVRRTRENAINQS